jgi:hypothetical protein
MSDLTYAFAPGDRVHMGNNPRAPKGTVPTWTHGETTWDGVVGYLPC